MKLTINIRDKRLFFLGSGLTFIYLIYHINVLTSALMISGGDILFYYLLCGIITLLFWTPFQFNRQFT